MTDIKLKWDGEKVLQQVKVEDKKLTPKEILDSLDQVRGQIAQMEGQKQQVSQQLAQMDKQIASAKEFEKERIEFESKCEELQKEKLLFLINGISNECQKKAIENANVIVLKDPSAYTEEQAKTLEYLEYQKALSTNKKVANKISRRIITKFLYDEPIFTNPF